VKNISDLELIPQNLVDYADVFTAGEDELLVEIEKFTKLSHPEPWMISGKVQGNFLKLISCMLRPENVLEIGTLTGYSAICLAEGMPKNGKLHTIEKREKDAMAAQLFFDKSKFANQIQIHTGDALEIIPNLENIWDLVFIDADKVSYIKYYEMLLPNIRKGGIIIADNVLFHGQVLEEPIKGKNAKAIHQFNEYVLADKRVTQVLLTVRDGLLLIMKN
jgi:predicted O-methyltransferase YrrM